MGQDAWWWWVQWGDGPKSKIFSKISSHTLFFGYWKIFLFVGVLTSSGSVVILSGTNPPLWV